MTSHKLSGMKKIVIIGGIVIALLLIGYFWGFYTPKRYNGIDVSHHNMVDWAEIDRNSDLEFCYVKATEGKSFKDKKCVEHSRNAKKICLNVGLYHYFRTDVPAKSQFDNFKSVYRAAYSNMIPAIDVEEQGNDFTDALAIPRLTELIELFEKEFGCKPIIYVGSLSCVKFIPEFWDCPLWLRAVKSTNIIPNTAIKQAAIINNIDMNYSPNVRKLMLDK